MKKSIENSGDNEKIKDPGKKRKGRRTSSEIDKSLNDALADLISKDGFSILTLSSVTQKAKVEPPVIYNNFGSLMGLLESFTQKYNHWLDDIVDESIMDFNESRHEAFLSKLLKGIAQKLDKDKCMQQLLIWEVQEKNNITTTSAKLREANTRIFSKFYENYFKKADVDFNMVVAILMAGIYYLILHKDVSTFYMTDITTKEGWHSFNKTIDKLCGFLFSELNPNQQILETALKLKKKGICVSVISECTGLNIEQVSGLRDSD